MLKSTHPEIHHHGATTGVTGSCHELRYAANDKSLDSQNVTGYHSLLIDCGLFQGDEAGADGARANQLQIGFDIAPIQALIVTHVHIDHVGRLPYLLAAGYQGPILASPASAELLPLVLEDALKVGFTRDQRLIERVLAVLQSRIVALPFGQWHRLDGQGGVVPLDLVGEPARATVGNADPNPDATSAEAAGKPGEPADRGPLIRLQRAGHILGSAYVEIDLSSPAANAAPDDSSQTALAGAASDKPASKRQRIVFSGDLGAPDTPLLPAPQSPERADILVLESTYGDRCHEDRSTRVERLRAVIEHALADGGTVLIPAFSIGRTQELLYELEGLFHAHGEGGAQARPHWQRLQVVLDSPLAADFTQGYRRLRQVWDDEAQDRLQQGRHPLAFEQLVTVDHHADHMHMVNYLAHSRQPAVVIAASGMCAGGRVVNYLKAMLGDPRHDVLFVGYQAKGTPGRDIQRYGPRGGYVMLDGERYDIRAQIHTIGGYSAHADQRNLIAFVAGIATAPAEIRLVHGDEGAKATLAGKLREVLTGTEVVVP
ncbi:MAG: MBL fold metallo-hydrolase RNA specificity domain-containing protein [Halochromatium sp.]